MSPDHARGDGGVTPDADTRDNLVLFAAGFGGAAVVGFLVLLLTEGSFLAGFGYTLIALAALTLLSGGVAGGRYAHLNIRPNQLSSRDDSDADRDRQETEPEHRGKRTESDRRAFWQVAFGIAYLAIGGLIVFLFPS